MYTVLSTRCQLCFRNAWIVPPSSEIDGYLVAHASQFTTSKLIIFDLGGCRVVLCGRVTLRERIVWFMGGGEICWHDERNKLRSRDNSTLLFPSSEMFELILTEFNFMLREIWTMTALAVGIHDTKLVSFRDFFIFVESDVRSRGSIRNLYKQMIRMQLKIISIYRLLFIYRYF